MSSLMPDRLREALERAHDKFGHFLTRLVPRKNEESLPEKITADAMPAFWQTDHSSFLLRKKPRAFTMHCIPDKNRSGTLT